MSKFPRDADYEARRVRIRLNSGPIYDAMRVSYIQGCYPQPDPVKLAAARDRMARLILIVEGQAALEALEPMAPRAQEDDTCPTNETP